MKDLISAQERLTLPLFPMWVYKAFHYVCLATIIVTVIVECFYV